MNKLKKTRMASIVLITCMLFSGCSTLSSSQQLLIAGLIGGLGVLTAVIAESVKTPQNLQMGYSIFTQKKIDFVNTNNVTTQFSIYDVIVISVTCAENDNIEVIVYNTRYNTIVERYSDYLVKGTKKGFEFNNHGSGIYQAILLVGGIARESITFSIL